MHSATLAPTPTRHAVAAADRSAGAEPHVHRRSFRPRAAIVHAGDLADAALLVERGLVALVAATAQGHDRIVAVVGAGDLVGAAEAVAGRRHGVDAVALTEVRVAATEREDFRRRLARDPEATLTLLAALGARLDGAWSDLAASYLPIETRLARALLQLYGRFAEPAPRGRGLLDCGLSHHALAALIGAHRPSVSEAMATLRAAGAAVGSRGRYLLDPVALRGFAAPSGADDAADAVRWPHAIGASAAAAPPQPPIWSSATFCMK